VLLLAGAPGPEVKQLRRWALDAGVPLQASVSAGEGLQLGEARPQLDAATLDRIDLVVVDERSWAALGAGERAALIAATHGGMGLLLRITGPVPDTVREQWTALGLPLGSGEESAGVRLASDPAQPAASSTAAAPDPPPQLTRRVVDRPAPGATALAQDADAAVLGRWRGVGRGRLGVFAVTDSSGLVTAGFADRYGELWSTVFGALARPSLKPTVSLDLWPADAPRAGRRLSLCGIGEGADVLDPNGGVTQLQVDPAAGPGRCAGYWPSSAGWRLVRPAGAKGASGQNLPLYVYPADALPHVRARALRDATLELSGALASGRGAATRAGAPTTSPGPAWPWLLLLLAVMASVWRFERARQGRAAEAPSRSR
jgi:hypothetical protein